MAKASKRDDANWSMPSLPTTAPPATDKDAGAATTRETGSNGAPAATTAGETGSSSGSKDTPAAATTVGETGSTTKDTPTATTTTGPAAAGATGSSAASRTTPPKTAQKSVERRTRLASGTKKVKAGSDLIRNRIASAVWLLAVLAAVVLAGGALLYALNANKDNSIVAFALDTARTIDGPFWRVFDFYKDAKNGAQGPPDDVKNHLVNWGLAAVAYLVAGRILDRIIRP